MHLVGFIIRIYHDARSSECQNTNTKIVYCLASRNLSHNEEEHCLRNDFKLRQNCQISNTKNNTEISPLFFSTNGHSLHTEITSDLD